MNKFFALALTSVLTLLAGCYPIQPEFVEDLDAVYTVRRDNTFDLSDPSFVKFYLADTVMVLTDPNTSATNITINSQLLLDRVRQNMLNAGYTDVSSDPDITGADYVVLVSINRTDNYFYTWWGGWGAWGGWGGGWGGWGFPPVVTSSNIKTGALTVELINARDLDTKPQTLPIVWMGMGEGLFRGSEQNLTNRSLRAIDQMFIQSPYLNR